MSASFPNAKKTFSRIVDGNTYMEAVNVNVVYDEVEAIETLIGALGSAQTHTDSIKNLLLDYVRGCKVDYKGVADLYVRSGEIAIKDASGNVRFKRNTGDTTVDWGDIDTGSEAASTTYYVYAVGDGSGTTFTVVISTNATTPSGCTFYKRLGSFYNNAGSNIEAGSFVNDTNLFNTDSGIKLGGYGVVAAYNINAGQLRSSRFLCQRDCIVAALGAGLQTVTNGTHVRIGIYDDSSTYPGTLLAETGELTVATAMGHGQIYGAINPIKLTAGSYYWIAFLSDTNPPQLTSLVNGTDAGWGIYQTQAYGAMPSSFPASGGADSLFAFQAY